MSESNATKNNSTTSGLGPEHVTIQNAMAVAAIGNLRGVIYVKGGTNEIRAFFGTTTDAEPNVICRELGDLSLGEIALLGKLCDKVLSDVYSNQSSVITQATLEKV
jgi:hypothetical protein